MKTTIDLPDDLFAAADALAGRLGMSRSELCAAAVAEFVARHSAGEVTTRLDRLYAAEPIVLAPDIRSAQRRSLDRERW